MRLKCIKLAGFKSFVDPTTVAFPSNLCAIVGPNGCGKSNVIDAVRWVMGESSAKNLRGESMTDVIFNGSGGRKPVGQASIELVFDNSEKHGKLVGEYASYNEISIKRKVTRDGQSLYYLNGTKCRRRDITDIFLGTGLGPRSYAIIEQGMISKLIEAKPEELRVFIEEAAGISKYKERRRDTENRMRRTMENLERLTDIRDELERQLAHLKRQAQAAERYTEFKKEERLLKAQLQAIQWKKLDEQAADRDHVIKNLEVQLEAVLADQRGADTEIEKLRLQHTELGDRFSAVQARFYSVGAEIARAQQTIEHQKERNRQLANDLERTEANLAVANEHLQGDSEKLESWQEELLEVEPEFELCSAREEEASEALVVAEEAMQHWQSDWDSFNQTAAEPRQRAEVQQSRIQHLEQSLQKISARIDRLGEESQALSAGPVEEEIEILQEQLGELELELESRHERAEQQVQLIEDCRQNNHDLGQELDRVRSELQSLKGRYASLEALQQAALGDQNDSVNQWLEGQGLADKPRLANSLRVREGWETAVETVLGEHLQAICTDDLGAIAPALDAFEKGCASFVDTTTAVESQLAAGRTSLAEQLLEGAEAASLLAGVLVADDLQTALAMRGQLQVHESVITPEGLWLGPNWLRVAREHDAAGGVIQRRQEMEQTAADIEALGARAEELQAQLDQGRASLSDAERLRDQEQQDGKELSQRQTRLSTELSGKQVRVEQISARRQGIEREIDENREQFQMEQESLGEARLILQDAIDAMENDTQRREELLQQRDQNRSVLDSARQSARHAKDVAHQLAMRMQSLQTQVGSIQSGMERARRQVQELQERRVQLQRDLSEGDTPLEDVQMELESHLEQRLQVEEELSAARAEVDRAEQGLREAEKKRGEAEQSAQSVRSQLEHIRLDAQSIQVRRTTLQEQLLDASFDLKTVLDNLPEEATEQEWEQQLQTVGNKIQRLGAINLAAIDEYKVQSERKVYLDSQNDDLMEALETLENAIKKIDRETRTRFKETFDKVNSGLKELFPKVFGGGHAYLELTGDDMLDTGIAIMARPPGKRNSTIHLLSGGEKALTAIALVFSIFRLNPAPFCMLDEVDAPLDDANVGRYARMVEEMSAQVQFIYITHNKIAMEMAHQLMGVTMHEPGVSRLVTVDVDEAAELAAV